METFTRLTIITSVVAICLGTVYGGCTKPVLNSNSYTLSQDKASYGVNETYEIYCVPGYVTSDSIKLVCSTASTWSSEPPTCTASEGTYPWWLLLVAVLVVVVVVACILPRLLHMCLGKKNKKNTASDVERNNLNQRDNAFYDDDDSDDDRVNSPVPDFTKQKKMNNMEFMVKLHKDTDKKTLKRATKNAKF